jgi:hypothetical protein
MGAAPSGTSPVRRVHFRAVTLIRQYAERREDTDTRTNRMLIPEAYTSTHQTVYENV